MTTDKSIEEIAQEYISYMKILEQAGSFAVFLSDRFGHYYYVTEYIEPPQELNIENLVHPDDLEVVRRIDKKVWEFLDTLPEEEKLTYKYIYEMRVLDRGKYVRMIYQMRILAFKDDNFLGMGIIDLAPEQSANTSVRFQIKNCRCTFPQYAAANPQNTPHSQAEPTAAFRRPAFFRALVFRNVFVFAMPQCIRLKRPERCVPTNISKQPLCQFFRQS